ncbi:MAG: chemotaxis protein CheZ [Saliniramus fredricksonii]|uniref:Chemotaxis protein CheZ n=1 Tax=Saliniramus fredricksonii TaxID=1653334 RepID=A0A0P7XVR4_9HYPH|nr:MAG: chemotaxis protein CheZ [Saliniramus fredricksonii]SCC80342.1 chemotaxis protein CheZ [Saliniramus fredricksonii]
MARAATSAAIRKTATEARPRRRKQEAGEAEPQVDIRMIAQELTRVADYISRLKNEIGALRANELYRDRLPGAHDELGNVVNATASATNSIMEAAEEILGYDDADLETYRTRVQTRVMDIFEACSFQDITGQRISKVVEHLAAVEKRLSHFASAVNARDADLPPDPEEARRQTRKEVFLLNGPSADGDGVSQNDIDALFD